LDRVSLLEIILAASPIFRWTPVAGQVFNSPSWKPWACQVLPSAVMGDLRVCSGHLSRTEPAWTVSDPRLWPKVRVAYYIYSAGFLLLVITGLAMMALGIKIPH
jgi:hypothetical protein